MGRRAGLFGTDKLVAAEEVLYPRCLAPADARAAPAGGPAPAAPVPPAGPWRGGFLPGLPRAGQAAPLPADQPEPEPEAEPEPQPEAEPEAAAEVRAPQAAEAAAEEGGAGPKPPKAKRVRTAAEVEERKRKKQRKKAEKAEQQKQKRAQARQQQGAEAGPGAGPAPAADDPAAAAPPAVDVTAEAFTGKETAQRARAALQAQGGGFTFNFDAPAAAAEPQAPAPAPAPAPAEEKAAGADPKRLYVGGLPYGVSDGEVRALFGEHGKVLGIDRLTFPDSGKFRGIAFLDLNSGRAARRAVEALDGSEFQGRTLQVRPCTKPKPKGRAGGSQSREAVGKTPGYHVAYVGNLAWDTDEAAVRELFAGHGCEVERVRLHTDQTTGAFRGFAHVHFDSEGVDRAVALNGSQFQGRELRVSYAVAPRSGSAAG